MRVAMFLAVCLACAVACAAAGVVAHAQGVPLPYAPGPGPRVLPGGPFMRGPFIRPPRGPFAMPLAHGPFGGPFVGPPAGAMILRPAMRRRFDPPVGRVCFNPMETRDKIITHRLTEPFQALRLGHWHGEALRAQLCRWKPEQFVYEIAVLRRDGRIVHVYMNAQNGQNVGAPEEPDE